MNHTPHSDKSVRRCLIAATIALFAATSPPSSVEPIVRDVQAAPAPLPASVPTARALLDAVSRYIGTAERLERIRSYRIESHGTQRFRALLSQEWIELPIVATVFWRDNLSARWTLTETIVDADGNDAIARREVGRVGDVSWTRDERDKCAEYLRISNLSDTVERNDPFRVLLREIPCHSQSFTEANIVGETTIDGRPCLASALMCVRPVDTTIDEHDPSGSTPQVANSSRFVQAPVMRVLTSPIGGLRMAFAFHEASLPKLCSVEHG